MGTRQNFVVAGGITVDTSTFFVDDPNNRVGIANTSPTVTLDVTGEIKASSTVSATGGLVIPTTSGAPSSSAADGSVSIDTVGHVLYIRSGGIWRSVSGGGGGESAPIGTIMMWAGVASTGTAPFYSELPSGWALCDGTAISRSTYSALFSAIGTRYGTGDGSTTFNLPSLTTRVPEGLAAASTPTASATITSGNQSADHSHTITSNAGDQTVDHSHTITSNAGNQSANHSHTITSNAGNVSADHSHGFSVNTGNVSNGHTHNFTVYWNGGGAVGKTTGDINQNHQHGVSGNTGGISANHNHGITSNAGNQSASHSHTITSNAGNQSASHKHTITSNAGNQSASHNHTVPTVQMYFIIKTT